LESKTKVFGHPIHPILIVFPLGLLATSVVFDVIGLVSRGRNWHGVSFYLIGAGVIGGLVVAVFGFIDWLAIPRRTRAKAIGLWHGLGNVIVAALFGISWLIRRELPESPAALAYVLSFAGAALAAVTGWSGGELVDRMGVGVDRGAHLDAPSSLSGRPAHENTDEALESKEKVYDSTPT
jgi:uncharacterized membrane protein